METILKFLRSKPVSGPFATNLSESKPRVNCYDSSPEPPSIGILAPPFGLNLFVMQSIFKKRLEELAVAVPPFFVVFLIALMIITYFPQLYLWLPRAWLGVWG